LRAPAAGAAFTRDAVTHAFVLLDNVINPNTGTIAEYKALSRCSEGPHWQASNAKKIGCLTQGFGEQQDTNTMSFISYTSIPKKPAYLRVVCTYQPEKVSP
jgi:hypothetical protein